MSEIMKLADFVVMLVLLVTSGFSPKNNYKDLDLEQGEVLHKAG